MQSGSSCVIVYIEPYGFKNIGFLGLDHSFKGNNFFAKSSGTSSNNKHWNTGETKMAFKECWYSNYKPKIHKSIM